MLGIHTVITQAASGISSCVQSCWFLRSIWEDAQAMKTRSIWSGLLRISLVTIPVKLYTALNEADKISFNQLHKGCHQRLRQHLHCPVHGKVEREDIVKGYEVARDRFVAV